MRPNLCRFIVIALGCCAASVDLTATPLTKTIINSHGGAEKLLRTFTFS